MTPLFRVPRWRWLAALALLWPLIMILGAINQAGAEDATPAEAAPAEAEPVETDSKPRTRSPVSAAEGGTGGAVTPLTERFSAGLELLYAQPFGDDADVLHPGFQIGAAFGFRPIEGLLIDLTVFYSRHDQTDDNAPFALDVAGFLVGLETAIPLPHVAIVLGGALGGAGLGEGKATQYFSFVGRLNVGVEVPLGAGLAIGVFVHPTLVAIPNAASFLLDIGARARWYF